ncbi:MAG: lipocalin family protein [Flavobacteriaceae bacterium]|nr:lipocalin family protein [Flavobacteriaceae bacterium]
MKVCRIFNTLFLVITFLSCSKGDDTPQPTIQEKIIGKWYIESYVGYSDECFKQSYINFVNDKQAVSEWKNYDSNNNCVSYYGESLAFYSLTANEDIVFDGGDTWHIITVSDTQLKVTSQMENDGTLIFVKSN